MAAIEKLVIFDRAAAVDSAGPGFVISIFPFKSKLGEEDGSGELDGLADVGFVGDGNLTYLQGNIMFKLIVGVEFFQRFL